MYKIPRGSNSNLESKGLILHRYCACTAHCTSSSAIQMRMDRSGGNSQFPLLGVSCCVHAKPPYFYFYLCSCQTQRVTQLASCMQHEIQYTVQYKASFSCFLSPGPKHAQSALCLCAPILINFGLGWRVIVAPYPPPPPLAQRSRLPGVLKTAAKGIKPM
jgi:hypothetical protein